MENKEDKGNSFAEVAEKRFEILSKATSPLMEMMKHATDATFPFVTAAYRGAFLLNGAAAIAVLSKKETLDNIGKIIVINGAKGALAAVLASFFMYLSQFYSTKVIIDSIQNVVLRISGEKNNEASGMSYATYFFVILSYVLFFSSIYFFWKSLSSLVNLL